MSAYKNSDVVTLVEWLIYAAREDERSRGYIGPPNEATGAKTPESTARFLAETKARLLAAVLEPAETERAA